LGNNRSCSISHEDKTSVSTVKHGLSPIWFSFFCLQIFYSKLSVHYVKLQLLPKAIREKWIFIGL
jgi:hypothetical protein